MSIAASEEQEVAIPVPELLEVVLERGASDLHLTVGAPPTIRLHGDLLRLEEYPKMDPRGIQGMIYAILPQKMRERLEQELELDMSYQLPGKARFRVNVYFQRDSLGAAFRLIPYEIKSLDDLALPSVVADLARYPRGFVVVTGPTGSGKSTTLAAMVDIVNRERQAHIMVGEMRDLETISTAITAAETGHLVFATLHTQDAPQTIDRIIDVFPPHQQQQVRVQLATTLQGGVTQQLLQTADGHGPAVAVEVLVCTPAVRNLIREGKVHQIYSIMQAGGRFGMQTMDQALANLVKSGKISQQLAYERCHDPEELNRLVGGGGASFDAGYGAAASAGVSLGDY